MNCSMPGLTVPQHLLELAQVCVHQIGDAIQTSHPLLPSSPGFNLSQHQDLFWWVGFSHQVAKVLELQFQHQSFQWIFRIDWLDLLAVQGTLKSLLQHYGSKPSILRHSAFFTVQLSFPYMTTGKTRALTKRTFVGKVVSLIFNLLCRFVIAFLPRSKCIFILWLQSWSAVILEPKSFTISIVSPSICHKVMRPGAMILVFWMLSSFKPAFSLSSSSRGSLVLCFLP